MKEMIRLSFIFILLSSVRCAAQIPSLIEKNGRHQLLVDGKPFLILAGQAHNSSAWPALLPAVWTSVETMHANTLEVPVYWEQIEPEQGHFDFSLVDSLLLQARQHNTRLVLLWFATWKNGSNHYMPEWMKRDATRFPNIISKTGKPVDSPSPLIQATMDADIKAFKALMKYLKAADPSFTVIMVQVENESGAWGSVRDYSSTARKLFEAPVPEPLLKPSVLAALNVKAPASGNWEKVFGERADEYFHAWHVAQFIGKVAAAGKAEYPLPMYANAALRDPLTNPMANSYESGGPTDNVIPIWKAAAPALDLVAPDIYISGSEKVLKVLDLYERTDNALFVPEAALQLDKVRYMYPVIAKGGIGFSPFGIDDNGRPERAAEQHEKLLPFGREYSMLAPIGPQLAQWGFEGKIKAVVEPDDFSNQSIDLGAWKLIVMFGGNGRANAAPVHTKPVGKLMVVQLDENKFLLMGTDCHLTFEPVGANAGRAWQYNKVEEGNYEQGQFKPTRIQNGDETDWGGPGFAENPVILRVSLLVR